MRVIGLVSGGKDSCYNMMQCVAAGHTIVALANIQPSGKDELDSYMYQTVGHQGISIIAEAMGLPLYRGTTKGNALEKGKMYEKTDNDEVEDLFHLLQQVKEEIHFEGVAVGAILSDYQRVRVENVCSRLGLVSLAYLWRRDQAELLQEMIDCHVYAIVIKSSGSPAEYKRSHQSSRKRNSVSAPLSRLPSTPSKKVLELKRERPEDPRDKSEHRVTGGRADLYIILYNVPSTQVAALGLEPSALGHPLRALQPQLLRARDKFGLNVCGEGGEYETFTLDCPLFKSRIVVDETQIVIHSNDPIAPAGYMNLLKLHLEPKPNDVNDAIPLYMVKNSLDYISDLNESSYSDLSDIELSESELENTEHITKQRRQSMSESVVLNPLLGDPVSSLMSLPTTYSCPSVLIENNTGTNTPSQDLVDAKPRHSSFCCKRLSLSNSGGNFHRQSSLSVETELDKENQGRRSRTHSRTYFTNPPSPIKYENEKLPIEDTGSIVSNASGWSWIGGIVGEGVESDVAMEVAMNKLCNLLASKDLLLTDVCAVTLFVRNMADYALFNGAYVSVMSFPNPPARVCVECPLPEGIGVILEALAHKWPLRDGDFDIFDQERHTMHVQGISHWAPANIGPYSQAVRVEDIINLAGQIPLVPGSMTLSESDGRVQCRLALRHVQRLLNAMDPKTQIRDVVQAVCYLTHPWLIEEARRQWERRTNNAIVDYVVVPHLPRNASLEWHVWAHRHNSRFEYEETGCSVGEYKIGIRRRWNYENNVAAVVCYVATGSSPSTSQLSFQNEEWMHQHKILATQITEQEISDVLEYCFKKLLSDYQQDAAVGLRIFYKVAISPSVTLLMETLKKFRRDKFPNLAFTVIPVIHLHNAFTFLSISAIRHESCL